MRLSSAALLAVSAALLVVPSAGAVPDPGWIRWSGPAAADLPATVRATATAGSATYAGTDGHGVFRSTDDGATWKRFSTALPAPATVVNAIAAGTAAVLIGTDAGVYRSDAGGPWKLFSQGPGGAKVNGPVLAVHTVRQPPATIAATSSGLMRTDNNGATWTPADDGLPAGTVVRSFSELPVLAASPLFASTSTGVYVSFDGAHSWSSNSDGLPSKSVLGFAVDNGSSPWYAATDGAGVFKSINFGTSWSPANTGLGSDLQTRALMMLDVSASARPLVVGTPHGAYTSTDQAVTWHKIDNASLGATTDVRSLVRAPGSGLGMVAGTVGGGVFHRQVTLPSATTLPTLSDTSPAQGRVLSASAGVWDGTGDVALVTQWERCGTPDPVSCGVIPDAAGSSYTPTDDDIGFGLRATVRASNAATGFFLLPVSTAISDPVTDVVGVPGDITQPSALIAPDSPATKVGDVLTAQPVVFDPAATSLAYRWFRCDALVLFCDLVQDSPSATYTLVDADGGHVMALAVAGTSVDGTGFSFRDNTSAPIVPRQVTKLTDPVIFGGAWVGASIVANLGSYSGAASFERHWESCTSAAATKCSAIPGADGQSATFIPASQLGKYLRMRVVVDVNSSLDEPLALTAVSKPIGPIKQPVFAPAVVDAPRILGGSAATLTLVGSTGFWSGAPTFTQRWLRCDAAGFACVPIAGATGLKLKLTAADLGRRIVFEVRGDNAWKRPLTIRTKPTPVVTKKVKPMYGGDGFLSGTFTAGRKVSAHKGTWGALPKARFTYQWTRNGKKIAGAKASTYTLKSADRGKTVTCVVTARNALGSAKATLPNRKVKK